MIHHYSRKGMPSLEYLGMAGSSKHSTHCSAGVHTGEAVRAKEKVQT